MREIDAIDREIVRLLQEDAEASQRSIAARVGLSQPSVSARIARLRASGILRSQVGVDPHAVGLHLAKIDVAADDPQALMDAFRGCPLLVNALLTLGETNVCLFMVGESVEHLEALVDMHIRPLPGVHRLQFQVVTRTSAPLVLPMRLDAARCDRTVCGYQCPTCRFYQDDLCTGCPATVHYRGRFWRETLSSGRRGSATTPGARTAPS